jgi:hypothetical protein
MSSRSSYGTKYHIYNISSGHIIISMVGMYMPYNHHNAFFLAQELVEYSTVVGKNLIP